MNASDYGRACDHFTLAALFAAVAALCALSPLASTRAEPGWRAQSVIAAPRQTPISDLRGFQP